MRNTDQRKIIDVTDQDDLLSKSAIMSKNFDLRDIVHLPENFAASNKALSKMILRDLNDNPRRPQFYLYDKDDISKFLQNPASSQKQLRDAAIYIYNTSSHFRRLIQYFAGLTDLSYVVSPRRIDTMTARPTTIGKQYRRVLNVMSSFDVKNQFTKILTVCLREDVFYGTMRVADDSIIIQQLPADYCDISVIEGNVINVSFNFSYFDSNAKMLPLYPEEFQKKYELYKNNTSKMKWQELDSPTSFAVKCNNDILSYAIPPFAGLLREVYDLQDYKGLQLTRTELENYAMLVMKLGINSDGEWEMDFDKAKQFYSNLDAVLPEAVGAVLSPMEISKISFDKSGTADSDRVAEAEQSLFSAAGVSSLLFNNEKASSNALLLSIKCDQAITYGIVKSIEGVVNRYIQSLTFGKNFKVTFLDVSPFNRKEMGEQYLKALQYGLPTISYYCVSQGLSQSEMDCMNFLEDDVLQLKDRFKPLQSASTISSSEGGAPEKEAGDLTDAGEASKENGDGDDGGL